MVSSTDQTQSFNGHKQVIYILFNSVKCQNLPANIEESTTYTNNTTTITTFTCPLGMSLKGNATLTCDSEGIWDGSVPTCGWYNKYT